MFKELLLLFLACLVITAMINGSPPQPVPAAQNQDQNAVASGSGGQESAGLAPFDESGGGASETSDETFGDDVLASQLPVLVDFSIQGCAPCHQMAPIIDSLAKEYDGRLKIVKLDADVNPKIRAQYNLNAFPTFIIFSNGKPVARSTGAMPKAELAQILNQHALTVQTPGESKELD